MDQGGKDEGGEVNPLSVPYAFNILVLVPVGLLTLLGGERGGRLACQGDEGGVAGAGDEADAAVGGDLLDHPLRLHGLAPELRLHGDGLE